MRKLVLTVIMLGIASSVLTKSKHPKTAFISDKILIKKTTDNYMEVRHIVLKGTNKQIGKSLGEIAQKWLGVKPYIYIDKIYGEANQHYLKKNYPILTERLSGVAQAYNLDPHTYFAGTLLYDLWPTACSVVYFPGNQTENGHGLIAHNLDFNTVSFDDFTGGTTHTATKQNNHNFFSRSFVVELYPTDGGYASIGIGSLDVLSGIVDGMNSRGLVVSMLVDKDCPATPSFEDFVYSCGLNGLQIVRLLLDSCATIEEVKIALLQTKYVATFRGLHFQVAEKSGRSVICEIDPKTFLWRFTDNNKQVQIMTNHAQHLYQTMQKFPESPYPYDSFNRYKKLYEYVSEHQGKFSRTDAFTATSLVYGTSNFPENFPMRTLWTELYDQVDKTLEVRFYLRDGHKDNQTGTVSSIFSEPFFFTLET